VAELFVEFSETRRRVSDLLNRIRQIKRRESKEEAIKAIEEAKSKLEKSRDDLKACLSRVGILTKLKREDWYRWIGRWVDVLNSTIRDLEVQASDIRKEIGVVGEEKKGGSSGEDELSRLSEEFWNGVGGIKKEVEKCIRLLNEVLSIISFGTPAHSVMTKTLREYLKDILEKMKRFRDECDKFVATTRNTEYFRRNFRNLYTVCNFKDLIRAKDNFVEAVRTLDTVISTEKRKTIPGLEKTYEEELAALYRSLDKVSEECKKTVEFVNNVDLDALIHRARTIFEQLKKSQT